ncbi:MAG: hypothetical protein SO256_03390, partial [Gemmiger sp.]|uniref:hypothetical protein n=1 Tax=Gemmiger sp. TaxID=2049027 RepID=UPI002A822E19
MQKICEQTCGGLLFCLGFVLSFAATLRPLARIHVILPLDVPFGHPKGTEKVPATSDSAGGP